MDLCVLQDDEPGGGGGTSGSAEGDRGSHDQDEGSHDQPGESRDQEEESHDQEHDQVEGSYDEGASLHVVIQGEDLGLPDDETSIDIPPSSVQAPPLRPTSLPRYIIA